MNNVLPRSPRYRHVVFSDDLRPSGQALDLTPRAARSTPERTQGADARLDAGEEAFVNWLLRQGGVQPADYKPGTLARRLAACLRALHCPDVPTARRQVERNPALVGPAIDALVIGVTSFFRDAPVFAVLRDVVLPDLLNRAGTLRVWSVGCSDGSEAYSLAMVLSELNALFRARIVGTDCRESAVRHATIGRYADDELRAVPPELRARYFVPDGCAWRVLDVLRRAVQFRAADALRNPEPGAFDLISCRNMAIYLNPEAAGRLWQNLEGALRPGGVLVLGKAETPVGAARMSQVGPNVFRRTRG